jgi:hypothetical protein
MEQLVLVQQDLPQQLLVAESEQVALVVLELSTMEVLELAMVLVVVVDALQTLESHEQVQTVHKAFSTFLNSNLIKQSKG